jgi:NADH-quinone oxidoreductase subunit F
MITPIVSERDLKQAGAEGLSRLYPASLKILVGSASCGVSVGAREVEEAARTAVRELGLDAGVCRTGCIGFCSEEPLVDLMLPGGQRVCYGRMTPDSMRELLSSYEPGQSSFEPGKGLRPETALCRFDREEHLLAEEDHIYGPALPDLEGIPFWRDLDFFKGQKRVILRNCGVVDPMSIEETLARGTYRAAFRTITSMSPDQVLEAVEASGLKGRGGAFFPTGAKWRMARDAGSGRDRYLVCNADEGAPAAYMDRNVLEGDPHAVLEGMLIGSHAIGAARGYIYVRSEYPLAIETLEHALKEAEAAGFLGENIFGTGWSFSVELRCGAGAYVCGEETALIESIEGRSGEPRSRPPYPVTAGLHGKPTVVNNVKTWASVPPVLIRGPEWYAGIGAGRATGTTIFSLEGVVKNSGLVEVPFGITLGSLVNRIGGGVRDGSEIKAIQAGGPSRGCIPPSMMDLAIDCEDRPGEAVNMGTGGVVVLGRDVCVVDMTRFLVEFFVEESCGKCTPCREGARQMLGILTRICEGGGEPGDLELLDELADAVKSASVCGLGAMAPNPVLAGLAHFREEFEEHVGSKKCVAGRCGSLAGKQARTG